ncbi:MAG: acyl-CoA thioesterase [Rhodobacteraceae bacterium]|nr:acyl-CoA thioesterase [Paracoccaceae bacterium]
MICTAVVPRVSETDGAGHINNTVAPIWFEAGRREIFRVLTPDLSFSDWRVALVNMSVDYYDQLYFAEEAEVRTWIERIGTKSFTLYEEIWQSERRCVTGMATYVCYDYRVGASIPIPTSCRTAFRAHFKQAVGASGLETAGDGATNGGI